MAVLKNTLGYKDDTIYPTTSSDQVIRETDPSETVEKSLQGLTITNLTYTSAEVATGIELPDNTEIMVDGAVNAFTVISSTGAGTITFVAGASCEFLTGEGAALGWSGFAPTFIQDKIYNVSYYNGTYYADGGR